MYHRFSWTRPSRRRNGISAEYEPLQPYFLLALIDATECKTFIDVGANIGAYSVLMSQAESLKKITAFEANPSAAAEMRANFTLNSIDAEVCDLAVSNRKGVLSFGNVSRLAGNSAVVETAASQTFHNIRQVQCVTLDEAIQSLPSPFALKVDVEGHEKQVLEGAQSVLNQPFIIQIENFENDLTFPVGTYKIAQIGPDSYYSNIVGLDTISLFEIASALMIQANHEAKSATIHFGNFAVSVTGKSYEIIKRLALRFLSSRL